MDDRTLARFMARVEKQSDGCWLWRNPEQIGYGTLSVNNKRHLAHRLSHEHFTGPIPDGYEVDHLCHNRDEDCEGGRSCRHRACVNPDHLEAVTSAENTRRAKTWEKGAARQREKTHCAHGHPYAGDNLRVCKDGRRACRECDRRNARQSAARQREKNPPPPRRNRKEFCTNGHPFAEFAAFTSGQRYCRACSVEKIRRSWAKKRAEQPPKPPMTHCKSGHEWVEANIYVNPNNNVRACRPCHNERTLAAYRRRKQAQPAA